MIDQLISELVAYGLQNGLIEDADKVYVTNGLLELFQKQDYQEPNASVEPRDLHFILEDMLAFALSEGILEDDTVTMKDLFDTKIMGILTPAPSVGPALGQAGVNIMAFVKEFNARTEKQAGLIIPVEITVFEDRSFTFVTKTPPAAVLLKKAAGLEKASGEPNKKKVAKLGRDKVREIAESKMADLNAASVEAAMRRVEGTARSMGIVIED